MAKKGYWIALAAVAASWGSLWASAGKPPPSQKGGHARSSDRSRRGRCSNRVLFILEALARECAVLPDRLAGFL